MTNIVPPIRISVAKTPYHQPFIVVTNASGGRVERRLATYAGPWIARIAIVR